MPRRPLYENAAARQKAHRERRKQEQAAQDAELDTLRALTGQDDTVMQDAAEALTQARLAEDPWDLGAVAAQAAVERQMAYDEGYQAGYQAGYKAGRQQKADDEATLQRLLKRT